MAIGAMALAKREAIICGHKLLNHEGIIFTDKKVSNAYNATITY
jgi:hypothetical protein